MCPRWGLSPRVRGNQRRVRHPGRRRGSIPACTGKPRTTASAMPPQQVYPRVYGETEEGRRYITDATGLSPRVRGNPVGPVAGQMPPRSIPACTGKPAGRAHRLVAPWVYPRVYGETFYRVQWRARRQGLSPRVRGNQATGAARIPIWGSIPACTGKPVRPALVTSKLRVYPRVYGETRYIYCRAARVAGLSPRVRGNHHGGERRIGQHGSIPACTGKPSRGA